MAGTVGLVAFGPSAQAATVDYNASCYQHTLMKQLPPTNIQVDIQVDPVKATYQVGDKVKVTWHWVKPAPVPKESPTSVDKDSALPSGEVLLAGAQSSTLAVAGTRTNPPAKVGEPLLLSDMTAAEITLTSPGDVTLTPGKYQTMVKKFSVDSKTTCEPLPPSVVPVSTTLKVEGQGTEAPTVTATPTEINAGGNVALAGDNWTGDSPVASLCAADGSACDPAKITAATLAVTAGKLSGNVTVSPTTAGGDYKIKVTAGGGEALSGVVKVNAVSQEKQVHVSPDHGPIGTTVTFSGSGYDPTPGSFVLVSGVLANGDEAISDYIEVDATGKFAKDYVIDNPDFAGFIAYLDFPQNGVRADFRVTKPGQDLTQTITGKISEGGLTISQDQAGVQLNGVAVSDKAQAMTGNINTVTVKDTRVAGVGWTLTGSITDFTTPDGGKITADKMSWTPAVKKADEASVGVPTAGSAGPVGTGATLAKMDAAPAGGTTAGTYAADAGLSLAVPAYAKAGTYTGTLTLSIS